MKGCDVEDLTKARARAVGTLAARASHDDIVAVSVVGQSDPVFGQVPVAYLVLQPDGDRTEERDPVAAVLERSRRRLEADLVRSKRPVSLRVVTELPCGATGKVQRRALREHAVVVTHQLDCP